MSKSKAGFILLNLLFSFAFYGCNGQSNFGTEHLQLIKTILLPEVKGRIDHMDINLKDQILYVAACSSTKSWDNMFSVLQTTHKSLINIRTLWANAKHSRIPLKSITS